MIIKYDYRNLPRTKFLARQLKIIFSEVPSFKRLRLLASQVFNAKRQVGQLFRQWVYVFGDDDFIFFDLLLEAGVVFVEVGDEDVDRDASLEAPNQLVSSRQPLTVQQRLAGTRGGRTEGWKQGVYLWGVEGWFVRVWRRAVRMIKCWSVIRGRRDGLWRVCVCVRAWFWRCHNLLGVSGGYYEFITEVGKGGYKLGSEEGN